MAWTHNFTRPNQTQERKHGRNERNTTPNQHQNPKSFLRAIQYFVNFTPNLSGISKGISKDMRQFLKKGTKWALTEERISDFNKKQ